MPGTPARLSRVTVTVEAASRRRPVVPGGADHGGELGAQRIEVGLGRRAGEVVAPAALRGIDVDADFGEPAFDHEAFEEAGLAAKRLAVGHEHRDEADLAGVADQFDEFGRGTEGDFAVGELDVADGAEPGAEFAELGFDLGHRARLGAIGVFTEVTSGAGEVAFGHRADGRAAAGVVSAEVLRRRAEGVGQARPRRRQHRAGLGIVLSYPRHARGLRFGRRGGRGGRGHGRIGLHGRREASGAEGKDGGEAEEHQDGFLHGKGGGRRKSEE